MKPSPLSIRKRLIIGALLVLTVFVAGAGLALEQAYADSVRSARYAKLQSDVYLLLAAAELDRDGGLVMPRSLAEPRFDLPSSGLYANIANLSQGEEWQSLSTLGLDIPFLRQAPTGAWRYAELQQGKQRYLAIAFGVRWQTEQGSRQLVFAASEDDSHYRQSLEGFRTTLWSWLGSAAAMLLLAQVLLLGWGLLPLARVSREIRRIEAGEQESVQGHYPAELTGLTDNLNALIERERARQTRYKDALADLSHSLKTPLAVLRGSLAEPDSLPQAVSEQVARMDRIVQHQLGRAAASGANRLAPPLQLQPVLQRICDSLGKVYRERELQFSLSCEPQLSWRLDEGDAFEVFGNLLDNAGKWAKSHIDVTVNQGPRGLQICISDDGPGISDPAAVLRRGVRADEQVPGHGIGLTVVADIVAAYGGQLEIGQATLGGALITVSFPRV